jgi:hypothetical protein
MSKEESIWEKLDHIPNPIYFGLLAIIVAAVLIRPIGLPITVSSETNRFFQYINNLPENALVYFEVAMLPADAGENAPFLIALCHHIFTKPVRIVFLTFDADGYFMYMKYVEDEINPQRQFGKVYGKDYIFLGYMASPVATMAAMAQDLYFPRVDYEGTPLTELEILKGVKDINDIDLLISITGAHSTRAEDWVIQWTDPYGAPHYIVCATAMTYPTYKPYYGTGKIEIMVSAASAAGEYEYLVGKPGKGLLASDAISMSHILVIGFIILGNIGYFARRYKGGLMR